MQWCNDDDDDKYVVILKQTYGHISKTTAILVVILNFQYTFSPD